MKFLHFLLFIFFSHVFFGQIDNWKFFEGIKVQNSSGILLNPWSGSFNNAQVNSIDLNFDGKEDLWIFDRVAQRSIVFRQENKQWIYDYALEKSLPKITDWLIIVDFDEDGKKDLFTSTPAGIKVFKNTSKNPSLSFELTANPLKEEGFSGTVNLYVATTDIPVIKDIDSDGDVDILAFESAGHIIEWHQNFSMENNKTKGLQFKKNAWCWGNIVYQDCSNIYLNQGCYIPELQAYKPKPNPEPKKLSHSGNALSYVNKDGKWNLWMSHVGCSNVSVLQNEGTPTAPYFSKTIYNFPTNKPITIPFASTFFADVNFDGMEDALVSPNGSDNLGYQANFQQSLLRLDQLNGDFQIIENDFLQNASIDVGENASPLFYDVDEDGDLDLLVANAIGQIYFYERSSQLLSLKSDDFGAISKMNPGNELILQIGDWNRDGHKELFAVSQTLLGPTVFWYDSQLKQWQKLKQGDLLPNDQLLSMDLDSDGKLESLILHRSGQVDLVNVQKTGNSLSIQKLKEDWMNLPSKGLYFQSFQLFDELGTGQLALIGLDKDGNFKKLIQENEQWKEVAIDSDLQNRFGKNIQINACDFTLDGKMDLLLGTSGGGVMLFENRKSSDVFQQKDKFLQVWPNPSSGNFYVRSTEIGTMRIIDLQGNVVLVKLNFPKYESIKFELNNLAKGIYFVQLETENGKVSTEKIILQ